MNSFHPAVRPHNKGKLRILTDWRGGSNSGNGDECVAFSRQDSRYNSARRSTGIGATLTTRLVSPRDSDVYRRQILTSNSTVSIFRDFISSMGLYRRWGNIESHVQSTDITNGINFQSLDRRSETQLQVIENLKWTPQRCMGGELWDRDLLYPGSEHPPPPPRGNSPKKWVRVYLRHCQNLTLSQFASWLKRNPFPILK